jgi:hypothetical protein
MRTAFERLPASGCQSEIEFLLARDMAEERAAILEFDAGLSRAQAEGIAFPAHGLPRPR